MATGLRWVAVMGEFSPEGDALIFRGREFPAKREGGETGVQPMIGQCICDRSFSEGKISAEISFSSDDPMPLAEIVFAYNPATPSRDMLTAGLGFNGSMFEIRSWNGQWTVLAQGGDRFNLKPDRKYAVQVTVKGS